MRKLTRAMRAEMAPELFAVPEKKVLPIDTPKNVQMSWGNVSATKDLTDKERAIARDLILRAATSFDIELKPIKLPFAVSLVEAMSLNISNDDGHPNKMPFTGILTRIDEPSDEAPHGSNGKRITISAEAAEGALQSLLGMAVDYTPTFDGHDNRAKVGLITAATIEGNAIHIQGFIYASDFPDVAAEIKANKDALGFSYEARNLYTNDPDANPLVITDCVFTGAAILRKDKAAYHSTSISASKDDDEMTPEQEKLLKDLGEGLATLSAAMADVKKDLADVKKPVAPVEANAKTMSMVEPHAKALESCAAAMDAAGVGAHETQGHAAVARKMAGHLRAAGALGQVPHIYRDHDYWVNASAEPKKDDGADLAKKVDEAMKPLADKLAALGTQLSDLKAAAVKDSPVPQRKTLTPAVSQLLAKAGLEAPADGEKLSLAKVDAALKEFPLQEKMKIKAALGQAGVID